MNEAKYSVLDDGRVIFRYRLPDSGSTFEVQIHCPIQSKLHDHQTEILVQHREWASGFHIPPGNDSFRRYCDTRFDLLAAYQIYDLPLEAAIVHSHLMTWFFVFDDMMDIDHGLEDDVRRYVSDLCIRHLEILAGQRPDENDSHCIHAFYDFLRKVNNLTNEKLTFWYTRMLHHLREYIHGAYWESMTGPTTDKNSNTALYMQVRHMAVGVAPCLDLMAIAADISGRPLADNYYIQRLERMAINYSIWVNDLAGLNRDLKRGLGNVIFTIQRDHSLSLEEATRMVARMCDGEFAAFLQAEKQLPMLLGEDYGKNKLSYDGYINVMKRWMRGLLDWSARSDRYQRLDVDMALQNDNSIRRTANNSMQTDA